tara:strand:+ start:246 stop:827 length:582 start_codon:yes stop_codon:yes gene_type:complete
MKKVLLLSALLIFAFHSHCQSPNFVLSDNYTELLIDDNYKEDLINNLTNASDETNYINYNIKKAQKAVEDFVNKPTFVCYYNKNLDTMVFIFKSEYPYQFLVQNEDALCEAKKNLFESFGRLTHYDCGFKNFNRRFYFTTETKIDFETELKGEQYSWKSHYQTEINGSTFTIAIHSDKGYKIDDVLIDINSGE